MDAFQKQQISQMTGLTREKVEEVLEAIEHVKTPTPAFIGPNDGPFHTDVWDLTIGKRDRTVKQVGVGRGQRQIAVTNLWP
mgnify:CR=1 FL=1